MRGNQARFAHENCGGDLARLMYLNYETKKLVRVNLFFCKSCKQVIQIFQKKVADDGQPITSD